MPALISTILTAIINIGSKLLWAIIVFVVGMLLIKLLLRALGKSKAYARVDPATRSFLDSCIKVALYIILAITIVPILGIEIASIITVLATAGAAIGLALQGSLSNLAGGIMLVFLKPFHIGDLVEAAGQTGVVRAIGIFYTELTTGDNKRVFIPNGSLMGAAIVNVSAEQTRRVDLTFTAAYGTDPDRVTALLLDVAEKDSRILQDPAPFARMTAQNDSSLGFTMRVWVNAGDYWNVYHDTLLTVHNRMCAEGIEIPFPQLDVHLDK